MPTSAKSMSLTLMHKAVSDNSMLRFLQTPDLPPYYRMKANLALSGTDQQNEPEESLVACHHHLKAAQTALAECRRHYSNDAIDVACLQRHQEIIEEEWVALQEREKEVYSRDSD